MFVRKNKNRSGSVSVQIVSKVKGKTKIIKTVGIAQDAREIRELTKKAKAMIPRIQGQASLLPVSEKEQAIDDFINTLANSQIQTIGPELIFGRFFDRIGFGKIESELFRHLVIARLCFPHSKLKTVDYLRRYKGEDISIDSVYRFLDELSSSYKEDAEQIAFEYTKDVLGGEVGVVFYDMTTLHFEAEDEDDLRKIGYSKAGKFRKPQIMLGLLVGLNGYPIGYSVFRGNKFEGHTLIPVLKYFQKKFDLGRPVVVADSALLSKKNCKELSESSYEYILGARIKNEKKEIKEKIFSLELADGETSVIEKKNGTKLIIGYSTKRAKKDKHNRKRGLRRLEKSLRSGRLTKKHINNRGYNKYLSLKGDIEVKIDYKKFEKEAKWEGLKGYVTNSSLDPQTIIENYTHLWQIEKAFRISKTDLRIRPIYHRLHSRIEAHICIAFVAYTIYKELERILYKHNAPFSVKRAGELTHNMYQISYTLPESLKEQQTILKLSPEQNLLKEFVDKELT